MTGLQTTPEMFDLRMSESARPLLDRVVAYEPGDQTLTGSAPVKSAET